MAYLLSRGVFVVLDEMYTFESRPAKPEPVALTWNQNFALEDVPALCLLCTPSGHGGGLHLSILDFVARPALNLVVRTGLRAVIQALSSLLSSCPARIVHTLRLRATLRPIQREVCSQLG